MNHENDINTLILIDQNKQLIDMLIKLQLEINELKEDVYFIKSKYTKPVHKLSNAKLTKEAKIQAIRLKMELRRRN